MPLTLGHKPKIIRGSNLIGIKTFHMFYLQVGFSVCILVQEEVVHINPCSCSTAIAQVMTTCFFFLFFSLIIISLGIIKYGCTIHFKTWKTHVFFTGTLYSQITKMYSSCNLNYCYTANQYHSVFLSHKAEESHKKN